MDTSPVTFPAEGIFRRATVLNAVHVTLSQNCGRNNPSGERMTKQATSSIRIGKIRAASTSGADLMGCNSALIRQWTILQRIATAKAQTIPKLASDLSVGTRTIRRDLEALQVARFPCTTRTSTAPHSGEWMHP